LAEAVVDTCNLAVVREKYVWHNNCYQIECILRGIIPNRYLLISDDENAVYRSCVRKLICGSSVCVLAILHVRGISYKGGM
jgi:hypothetical protein